jgi:hypothetical protein
LNSPLNRSLDPKNAVELLSTEERKKILLDKLASCDPKKKNELIKAIQAEFRKFTKGTTECEVLINDNQIEIKKWEAQPDRKGFDAQGNETTIPGDKSVLGLAADNIYKKFLANPTDTSLKVRVSDWLHEYNEGNRDGKLGFLASYYKQTFGQDLVYSRDKKGALFVSLKSGQTALPPIPQAPIPEKLKPDPVKLNADGKPARKTFLERAAETTVGQYVVAAKDVVSDYAGKTSPQWLKDGYNKTADLIESVAIGVNSLASQVGTWAYNKLSPDAQKLLDSADAAVDKLADQAADTAAKFIFGEPEEAEVGKDGDFVFKVEVDDNKDKPKETAARAEKPEVEEKLAKVNLPKVPSNTPPQEIAQAEVLTPDDGPAVFSVTKTEITEKKEVEVAQAPKAPFPERQSYSAEELARLAGEKPSESQQSPLPGKLATLKNNPPVVVAEDRISFPPVPVTKLEETANSVKAKQSNDDDKWSYEPEKTKLAADILEGAMTVAKLFSLITRAAAQKKIPEDHLATHHVVRLHGAGVTTSDIQAAHADLTLLARKGAPEHVLTEIAQAISKARNTLAANKIKKDESLANV